MARGSSLISLLTDLRAEIRVSQNPAHNNQKRDEQINLLQRTQEFIWEKYDWPHMKVRRQYALEAGQRYYDFNGDFDLERIETIEVMYGGVWRPLGYGITPGDLYVWNSDLDRRSWPVRKCEIYEGDQIELWPIPDRNGDPATLEAFVQVKGVRKLNKLVEDSDRADLDDKLIVLYAAAEVLGGRGSKDAQLKLQMAEDRFKTLRGRLRKKASFRMFGVGQAEARSRPFIASYKPPISVS